MRRLIFCILAIEVALLPALNWLIIHFLFFHLRFPCKSKKRKWIISQFRAGRSATSIARIQKISRRMVYKLAARFKKEGVGAYKAKKVGRPRQAINHVFVKKTIELRKTTDYGSEKLHFVLKRVGFGVSQYMIQRILDEDRT